MRQLPSSVSHGGVAVLAGISLALSGCEGGGLEAPVLHVIVATTGIALDPDGYILVVDDRESRRVGANHHVGIADLAEGEHTLQLTGLAENCVVAEANPQTVTVAGGTIARATFSVSCGPTEGSLTVRVVTAGPAADPDGYLVSLDGSERGSLGANDEISLGGIPAGSHEVSLGGVAPNCRVQEPNPQAVVVAAGETATLAFTVTCEEPPPAAGVLRVSTVTGGAQADPDGYAFAVDGGPTRRIGVNASETVADVAPGSHRVALSDVAGNCTVQGPNPRTVTVGAGQTTAVEFTITCAAPPPRAGSLRIATTTSGPDPDADGYTFAVDSGAPQPIGVNAAASVAEIAAGDHVVALSGVATNCTLQGANPRTVTVSAGDTAEVSFSIACVATTGTIRVSVATSGAPADPDGYAVTLDGSDPGQAVAANGTVSFTRVRPGSHVVALTGLAGNCTVTGDVSRTVNVTAGATTEVTFAVTCAPTTGAVTISVGTTGGAPDPDGYAVSIGDGAAQPIPASGSLTVTDLSPGTDSVTLSGLAANCRVEGANPRPVTVAAGDTATVAFSVHCPAPTVARWSPTQGSATDIWGVGPADIFAVGGTAVLHYDGTAWSAHSSPENADRLEAVWGSSPSDLHVAGADSTDAVVYRYDGTTWVEAARVSPDVAGGQAIFHGMWGAAPRDIFAVGSTGEAGSRRALIARYDGTAWRRMTAPEDDGLELYDVWGVAGGTIYAVGVRWSGSQPQTGVVIRFDGTTWSTSLETPQGVLLRGVWANSATDVFTVASDGSIWHFDGSDWTLALDTESGGLHDIWGSAETDVFAVGEPGVILHYDGLAWNPQTSGTTVPLRGIWGGSGTDVWAVGDGLILHGTR
jgi:preprotein translocase subunit YajC